MGQSNMGQNKGGDLRIGVLASGRGSNLQSIINNVENGKIKGEIAVVISDNKDAFALERACRHNIAAVFIDPKGYASKREYEFEVVRILKEHRVGLVCLAGYMRLVGKTVLDAFPMRVMNIHPALLPAFPGLNAQKQAWEYGVRFSGCTVHFVDEGMDTGPIILQAVVPVLASDTPDTLAARILEQEHRIYPEAIRLFAEGRLEVEGRRVIIKDARTARTVS